MSEPMVPRRYRVTRAWREIPQTWSMTLTPLDGPLLPFAPGQFNMLYVFGVGEIPVSISGDPAHPEILVHTTRAVGATSSAICALRAGDEIGVRGPFGRPWPIARATGGDVVLVAGGIGLAPLRPAIYSIVAHRPTYG